MKSENCQFVFSQQEKHSARVWRHLLSQTCKNKISCRCFLFYIFIISFTPLNSLSRRLSLVCLCVDMFLDVLIKLWWFVSGTPSPSGTLTLWREPKPRDASETWQVQTHISSSSLSSSPHTNSFSPCVLMISSSVFQLSRRAAAPADCEDTSPPGVGPSDLQERSAGFPPPLKASGKAKRKD